jgi:hypothetical protein
VQFKADLSNERGALFWGLSGNGAINKKIKNVKLNSLFEGISRKK